MSMRGEGFNPEIAKEANREGGAREVARKERSFLDSLRKGAERHRLALAFAFSGALAEAMSGSARAQEAGTEKPEAAFIDVDALEAQAWEDVEVQGKELSDRFEDLRAPYVFIDGFEKVYHTEAVSRFTDEAGRKQQDVQSSAPQKAFKSADALREQRLVVSSAVGLFDDVRSASYTDGEKRHKTVDAKSMQKSEMALYASAPEENDIAGAESFRAVGWGESEDEAVAHALRAAGQQLATQVRADRSSFRTSRAEDTTSEVRTHEVVYSSGISMAFIEGFTVTKMEKRVEKGPDGTTRTYHIAHVEGLGNAVTMSQPEHQE